MTGKPGGQAREDDGIGQAGGRLVGAGGNDPAIIEVATAAVAAPAVARLGVRYGLTELQKGQLSGLLAAIAADPHAPTSVRAPLEAVDVHLADSLTALDVDPLDSPASLSDLGAGAGFPGLPLAIARPGLTVNLVESQARKCRFLMDVLAAVGVANCRVVCSRVEAWSEGRGRQDVVLARALAPQPVVLEYAAPLLKPGGTLIDWRGSRSADEEASSVRAATELGLELTSITRVQPFPDARAHHLHVYRKVSATPERFPRRPGMARKRPLG